jgi:hypothetical protein
MAAAHAERQPSLLHRFAMSVRQVANHWRQFNRPLPPFRFRQPDHQRLGFGLFDRSCDPIEMIASGQGGRSFQNFQSARGGVRLVEHFAPTYVQIYEHSPATDTWKLRKRRY